MHFMAFLPDGCFRLQNTLALAAMEAVGSLSLATLLKGE